jgi:hypothetical protein
MNRTSAAAAAERERGRERERKRGKGGTKGPRERRNWHPSFILPPPC